MVLETYPLGAAATRVASMLHAAPVINLLMGLVGNQSEPEAVRVLHTDWDRPSHTMVPGLLRATP
jgi:hypothetical protein